MLRSHDAVTVRRLSAMAQFVGYVLGAMGPFVVGVLNEVTRGWTVPLLLLLVVCAGMAAAGRVAGRDVPVGRPSAAPSR